MATSAATILDRNAKSSPDIAKLGQMTNRVVQVTKHLTKNGAGQLVVPATKGVTVDQITALQTEIVSKAGPGTYHFEVYDEGGPEKDAWTVRLGAEVPTEETATTAPPGVPVIYGINGPSLAFGGLGQPASTASNTPSTPLNASNVSVGSIDIGGGYRYNEALGLLVTPDKRIIQWRPGEELPGATPAARPAATPWQTWTGPNGAAPPWAGFGWGAAPTDNKEETSAVRALEARLRETEARAAEEARRREFMDIVAQLNKQREESERRFEMLLNRLTEAPKGPDPAVEELKRANEQLRQELQNQRREDASRAEIQRLRDEFMLAMRELSQNKADPMLTALTQIMSAGQQAQAEVVRAIRDTSAAQAASAERNSALVAERLGNSIMSPLQMVELIKLSRDNSANSEINKSMVDMFQNLFGMAKGLVREQAEMYSQSGGPAWLPIAQEGVQTLGRVAQMYAQAKAAEAARQERQVAQQRQQLQVQQQQLQRQQLQLRQQQQQQQQQVGAAPSARAPLPSVAPATSAASLREAAAAKVFQAAPPTAASAQRDAAAAQVFASAPQAPAPSVESTQTVASTVRRGRKRSAQPMQVGAVIQADGSIVPLPTTNSVPLPTVPAPPLNGAPASTVSSEMPSVLVPPSAALADSAESDADDSDDSSTDEGAATDSTELSAEDIAAQNQAVADATVADLRVITDQINDEEFFGPALSEVENLRQRVKEHPDTIGPGDIAKFVIEARGQLISFGVYVPAIEVLDHDQVEILVERLLPGLPPAAMRAIVDAVRMLRKSLGAA